MSTLSLLVRVTFAVDMIVDDCCGRYEVVVVVMRLRVMLGSGGCADGDDMWLWRM